MLLLPTAVLHTLSEQAPSTHELGGHFRVDARGQLTDTVTFEGQQCRDAHGQRLSGAAQCRIHKPDAPVSFHTHPKSNRPSSADMRGRAHPALSQKGQRRLSLIIAPRMSGTHALSCARGVEGRAAEGGQAPGQGRHAVAVRTGNRLIRSDKKRPRRLRAFSAAGRTSSTSRGPAAPGPAPHRCQRAALPCINHSARLGRAGSGPVTYAGTDGAPGAVRHSRRRRGGRRGGRRRRNGRRRRQRGAVTRAPRMTMRLLMSRRLARWRRPGWTTLRPNLCTFRSLFCVRVRVLLLPALLLPLLPRSRSCSPPLPPRLAPAPAPLPASPRAVRSLQG